MNYLRMSREDFSEIRSMFVPVFVEQMFISGMALVVSAMVKGSGMAAVGAVNLLNSLTMLLQQAFMSIGVGTTVVVAQYRGRGNKEATGSVAAQAILLSVITSTTVAVASFLFMGPLLGMMLGEAEPLMYDHGRTYLVYNILSLPFIAIYTVSAAALRGAGSPRISLYATIVHNGAYALMGYASITFFNGGLPGVSLSLLLSRIFAALAGVYLIWRGNNDMRIKKIPTKLEKEVMRPIFRVGIPLFLEQFLFTFGRLITQRFSVPYGTNSIAANGIAMNLQQLVCVPGTAASNAAPPVVGKYIGQGDLETAKRRGAQFVILTLFLMAGATFLMVALSNPIARWMSDAAAVQTEIVGICMTWLYTYPIFWSTAFVLPNVLRSSGDGKFTSAVCIGAMIFMRIALSYLLTMVFHIGVVGIWIGMYADWVFRTAFFIPRFMSGKWLELRLLDDKK